MLRIGINAPPANATPVVVTNTRRIHSPDGWVNESIPNSFCQVHYLGANAATPGGIVGYVVNGLWYDPAGAVAALQAQGLAADVALQTCLGAPPCISLIPIPVP